MENILVTGGAGFIGSHFVDYLLEKELVSHITILDLLTYAGSRENIVPLEGDKRLSFVQGDICDTQLVRELISDNRIDTIVNFASQSHVDRSISDPSEFIRTNIEGTYSLLEAAKDRFIESKNRTAAFFRYHQISTDDVYGSLEEGDAPSSETSGFYPRSPYSASKASGDHLVLAYHHTYGLPVTVSHCTNNYGPRQHPEKLIPKVIDKCLHGDAIPVYGTGKNIRDWIHVKDHCAAVASILLNGKAGERYNAGSDNPWRNIDLVNRICSILDKIEPGPEPYSSLITYIEDRKGHDWRYDVDSDKLRTELGWRPEVDFEDGLTDTVRWYLNETSEKQISI
jgi:dTDP-glucose 4,6-dehydratase